MLSTAEVLKLRASASLPEDIDKVAAKALFEKDGVINFTDVRLTSRRATEGFRRERVFKAQSGLFQIEEIRTMQTQTRDNRPRFYFDGRFFVEDLIQTLPVSETGRFSLATDPTSAMLSPHAYATHGLMLEMIGYNVAEGMPTLTAHSTK